MERIPLQSLVDAARSQAHPQRFMHVLGVTHAAIALAVRHGLDPWRAAVAGLLHDRTKFTAPEEIQKDLHHRGERIEADDREFPGIWHGYHAAVIARQDLGLTEADGIDEIAEAVQFHSTGERGIGPLAKALFIADFTEPGRDFDGIDELRETARRDLDEAYRLCLERKGAYLKSRGIKESPRARRALEAEAERTSRPILR
jgi:predicted HD superfamily hydrolase involved in NAD metabolism